MLSKILRFSGWMRVAVTGACGVVMFVPLRAVFFAGF